MTAFFVAPRIASGPGAIEQLSALGARRAAIIVDPTVASQGGQVRLVEEFDKTETATQSIPMPKGDPSLDGVEALAAQLRAFAPDWIVALGGGATIDGAKAAWIRSSRPDLSLESISPLVDLRLRAHSSFVAVPTTSGSGSEVSWTALVRAPDGRPIEIASRELVPDWALLDSRFPATMPPALTAETTAEFVGLALEAIASEWSNPFTDALAREAIGVALQALPVVVKHPADGGARDALHHAATIAGLAASNAQLGAAHALAAALGPESNASYGRLMGVLVPYVAEFNYPSARERYGGLSSVLGGGAGKDRSAIAERLRALWAPAGIPKTLAEAGLPSEVLTARRTTVVARARASMATVANPRVPTEEEYGRLLDCAYHGTPVTF